MTERRVSTERDAAIDDAFARALDMDAADRHAFMSRLAARDAQLAAAVAALLRAAAAPDPRLDPEQWVGRQFRREMDWPAADPHPTGQRVGNYRVLEEIGRGGMSVVYLAERADGLFDQTVALKFLGVTHEAGVRRLERERRILAGLNHPAIAPLLDGGTDERGRPYIVMEYVRGRPLDVYCRDTNADLARRIELIAAIADAVEYAHRNLVVHRDIKPSNILVTDEGRVKLLDFGIAKLLADDDADDAAPLTRTMVRLLTPEYASPEQVRGERITTASDVYQLGVVLYELLSGQRPFTFEHASPSEIERIIADRDPAPPSAALARTRPPHALHTGAERAGRALRGDLDTIVLKALAKEPERRYATVGELRDDLRRYLRGEAVHARPQTVGYRTRKFLRRHRAGVLAIVSLVIVLSAWAGTVTVQSQRLAAEAERTHQVREILAGLFTAANPGVNRGADPTASQLLDAGAQRVMTELADQPELQAELLTLLGNVYGTLGRYQAAADLLEPALEIRRRTLRRTDPRLARTAFHLGQIRHIQGRLDEAEALLREALLVRRATGGDRGQETALILDELGDLLHTRGALHEAEPVLRRALALHAASGGDGATVRRHLANVLRDRGVPADAEALYRESLAITEPRLGQDDPISALTRSELAVLLAETDRTAEAESLLQQNRAIYAVLYPEGHAMQGTTLRNLGLVRLRQGRYDEAHALLEQAITTYRHTLHEHSSLILRAERYLAEAHLGTGDFARAASRALNAANRLREQGLTGHPARADALDIAGSALLALSRSAEAADHFAEALTLRLDFSADGDPRLETTRRRLADAMATAGSPR